MSSRDTFMITRQIREALVVVLLMRTFVSACLGEGAESPIKLDGDFSDWADVPMLATDAVEGDRLCDWREFYATHDKAYWYVRYVCAEEIDFKFRAAYNILIDADRNGRTGYRGEMGRFPLGAEHLIQGGVHFVYDGQGTNWVWRERGYIDFAADDNQVEMAIPRNGIGSPYRVFFVLYGDNQQVDRGENDFVPNSTIDSYSPGATLRYSFRKPE